MIYNKDNLGNEINIGDEIVIPKINYDRLPHVAVGKIKLIHGVVVDIQPTLPQFWFNTDKYYLPEITIRYGKKTIKFSNPDSCIVIKKGDVQ